jgi:anti-sigma regulatory factor (Ser/Thr protein kinase)
MANVRGARIHDTQVNVPIGQSSDPAGNGAGIADQLPRSESPRTGRVVPLLRTHLKLGAFEGAIPCVRLHARLVLQEWRLADLAETVELVVSEIATNAVKASQALARSQRRHGDGGGAPTIQLWLSAEAGCVLVQVWDGNHQRPVTQQPGMEAEGGRGLLLVDTLCQQWGVYTPDGWPGKVVWARVGIP